MAEYQLLGALGDAATKRALTAATTPTLSPREWDDITFQIDLLLCRWERDYRPNAAETLVRAVWALLAERFPAGLPAAEEEAP